MVKRRRGYKRSWNAPPPLENPSVPPGPPPLRYPAALIAETREVWQPCYPLPLSDEDCAEIIMTMTEYAWILIRDAKDRAQAEKGLGTDGDRPD